MTDIDENVNVQDEAEYVAKGIEKYLLKQSMLDQKTNKKSKSTKRAISKTKKEKSIYIEMLNLLIENKKKILSYKSGRKVYKILREDSYSRFIVLLREYSSKNGIDEIYFCEWDIESRDIYLEWLYGIKQFKSGVNDLSKYNSCYFDYIIDAPYVYTDKITGKTYLYIELHYENRIKSVLIDSASMSNKNLLYKVIANQYEMDSFRREVYLSHKLAMITSKNSSKYRISHDSDEKKIIDRIEEDRLLLDQIRHLNTCLPKFNHKTIVKEHFSTVMDIFERYDLIEFWGLLVNYNYAYPKVCYNKYYFAPGNANTYIAVNLIHDILEWLKLNDCIPIIVNSDKKMNNAFQKNNSIRCSLTNYNICGVIIKTDAIDDKKELKGISFDEYEVIKRFFTFLGGDKSDIDSMCYNHSEKKLYEYLKFIVNYSSVTSNENVFAAFNGLYYFFSYFVKSGIIKYDTLFKVLKSTFNIEIDIDEIIKLQFIPEDSILTEKTAPIDIVPVDTVNDKLQNKKIDEYEFNIPEQQQNTVSKQYDNDEIERVYKLMCHISLKKYKIYDKENKEDKQKIVDSKVPFLKYFKKKERYALCFLEDKKTAIDEKSEEMSIETFITNNFKEIDGVIADEKVVDMLYECIIEHNRKINKKTVGPSNNLVKYNVFNKQKYYLIFLDIDNLNS